MQNPHPIQPGFHYRVFKAAKNLRAYASTSGTAKLYTRAFDNCFEMFDGNAVVWELMRRVEAGDFLLEAGIRLTGMWDDWLATYRRSFAQPDLLSCTSHQTV